MAGDSFADKLGGVGVSIADMFVNLSAEYPSLLNSFLIVIAACGVLISASAVFDFIKSGGRRDGNSVSAIVFYKMVGGVSLVELAVWTKVWTDTLWSLSDPLDIGGYTAGEGESYGMTAIYTVIGFMVLVGYVTLAKAYFSVARIGYLSPESRADMYASIVSRIVAGSALVACMHIAKAFENSTGFNFIPG